MASNKDLVEAHAYQRRRLLAAFVAGGPGEGEVQPPRQLRLVIGSAVLAGLLLGGFGVADQLEDGTATTTNSSGVLTEGATP